MIWYVYATSNSKSCKCFPLRFSHLREAKRIAAQAFVLLSTHHPLPTNSQSENAHQMEAQLFQASSGPSPVSSAPPPQLLPQDSELTSDPRPSSLSGLPVCVRHLGSASLAGCDPEGPSGGQPLLLGHHLLLQDPSLTMWLTLSRLSVSPHRASCFIDALRASPAPEVILRSHRLVHWLSFPPSAPDAELALCFSLG